MVQTTQWVDEWVVRPNVVQAVVRRVDGEHELAPGDSHVKWYVVRPCNDVHGSDCQGARDFVVAAGAAVTSLGQDPHPAQAVSKV